MVSLWVCAAPIAVSLSADALPKEGPSRVRQNYIRAEEMLQLPWQTLAKADQKPWQR